MPQWLVYVWSDFIFPQSILDRSWVLSVTFNLQRHVPQLCVGRNVITMLWLNDCFFHNASNWRDQSLCFGMKHTYAVILSSSRVRLRV